MLVLKQYEHLRIPLADIVLATNNFSKEHCIGGGGFGEVFEGNLFSRGVTRVALKRLNRLLGQGDSEFWKEVMTLSDYKHENIISLLGFCDEKGEKILVYPYAPMKSLDTHLDNKELRWVQRLRICIGAAEGLAYLHDPAGTQQRLLHRDIKSSNILLDENWNALIADFGLSKFGPANMKNTFLVTGKPVGTFGYADPEYIKSGILTKESDIYSFGVVLFEVLCGRLCILNTQGSIPLARLVRKHYKEKTLNEIVLGGIKDEIHLSSLKVFSVIAYQCLKRDHEKRPSIKDILRKLKFSLDIQTNKTTALIARFEHLRVPLDDILLATNNFAKDNWIGEGGFGKVFEGILVSRGKTRVAIKVLDSSFGQGDSEFWKEIMMLSQYKHENVISLLGFCDEKMEKILMYTYAPKKGLDTHLDNKELTWVHRLRICIGAARGLAYLHNPAGTQQRLLHRDIKSSNILLDENWNALIADFGLPKFGPANQKNTFLITGTTVGTLGYVDPQYIEDGMLTKESDVYSFGVVLFEVLCGRLCIVNGRSPLPPLVRKHMKSKKLNDIVWDNIRDEIHPNSLKVFSKIAYQCLRRNSENRPRMEEIVRDLEICLEFQVRFLLNSSRPSIFFSGHF